MLQQDNNQAIELLNHELERAHTGLNKLFGFFSQALALAVTIIGGLVIYIFMVASPPITVLFLAPVPALALVGIGIVIFYQIEAHIYFIRELSYYIKNQLDNEDFPIFHAEKSFPSRLLSLYTGDKSYRIISFGLILIALFLFVGLGFLSFLRIYTQSHFLGSVFALFFLLSIVWTIVGFTGMLFEVPKFYRDYVSKNFENRTKELKFRSSHISLFNFILPRPIDFYTKALLFGGGVILALLEGFIEFRPALQDAIISPISASPYIGVIFYILLWFLIQEGIVQQAKYLWNDIRDRKRDKVIPANQGRFIATQEISKWIYLGLLIRWLLGFLLAYLFSFTLFILCLYIFILQAIYELWAKPRASKFPQVSLFIVAGGSFSRLLGGALSVGWLPDDPRLWLYSVIFFVIGMAYAAAMWKIEAEYLQINSIPLQRGQSLYFIVNGNKWLLVSAVIGVSICVLLVTDAYNALPSSYTLQVTSLFPFYINIGLFFIISSAYCQIVFWIVILLEKIYLMLLKTIVNISKSYGWIIFMKRLYYSIQKYKLLLTVIAISVGMLYLLLSLGFTSPIPHKAIVSLGTMILVIALYWMYSTISYPEFALMYLRKNFPVLMWMTFTYLFVANSPIKLLYILHLATVVNKPDFEELLGKYEVNVA